MVSSCMLSESVPKVVYVNEGEAASFMSHVSRFCCSGDNLLQREFAKINGVQHGLTLRDAIALSRLELPAEIIYRPYPTAVT